MGSQFNYAQCDIVLVNKTEFVSYALNGKVILTQVPGYLFVERCDGL